MNYFRNVILMLSQRQKQTHQQGRIPCLLAPPILTHIYRRCPYDEPG